MALTKVQKGITDSTIGRGRISEVTHNMTTDANYTLTDDQNLHERVIITDTGVVLTATKVIIVNDDVRTMNVTNSTAQTLTISTLAGSGIAVVAGASVDLRCDGTDVKYFTSAAECKAWVSFNGTLAAASMIQDSFNVSSITDNGTGDYTINFTTAMPTANYSVVCAGSNRDSSLASTAVFQPDIDTAYNVSWVKITNVWGGTTGASDVIHGNVAIFSN